MGRPRKHVDLEEVRKLAALMCTHEEIAAWFGVNARTLTRRKGFVEAYKKGQEHGRMSLRRMQYDKAQSGNTAMLIWLGKQWLGQRDKQELAGEFDHTHKGKIDLAKMTTSEMLEAFAKQNGNGK